MDFRWLPTALPFDGVSGANTVVECCQLYRPDQTAATSNAEEDRWVLNYQF